jgi:predicted aspartyl protease
VPIEVTGPNGKKITDSALIDTGADTSAFPLHWMRRLGVLKKNCDEQEFLTAGGCANQWNYEPGLDAVIVGRRIKLTAVFVDTPVALLGREDFMAEFEVWFDQRGSRYALRPY